MKYKLLILAIPLAINSEPFTATPNQPTHHPAQAVGGLTYRGRHQAEIKKMMTPDNNKPLQEFHGKAETQKASQKLTWKLANPTSKQKDAQQHIQQTTMKDLSAAQNPLKLSQKSYGDLVLMQGGFKGQMKDIQKLGLMTPQLKTVFEGTDKAISQQMTSMLKSGAAFQGSASERTPTIEIQRQATARARGLMEPAR